MANDFYNFAQAIVKSDTVNFPQVAGYKDACDAIFVGGAGNTIVEAVLLNGQVVQFTITQGEIIPVNAKRVNSSNTTATLMVALYQI